MRNIILISLLAMLFIGCTNEVGIEINQELLWHNESVGFLYVQDPQTGLDIQVIDLRDYPKGERAHGWIAREQIEDTVWVQVDKSLNSVLIKDEIFSFENGEVLFIN